MKCDNNLYTENEIEKMEGKTLNLNSDKHSELPDVNFLLEHITNILEYMCTDQILKLRNNDFDNFEKHMEEKFPIFSNRFYGLFKKILSGDDLTMLWSMLSHIDKINNKKISIEDAEKNLGDELANKYIPNYKNIKK